MITIRVIISWSSFFEGFHQKELDWTQPLICTWLYKKLRLDFKKWFYIFWSWKTKVFFGKMVCWFDKTKQLNLIFCTKWFDKKLSFANFWKNDQNDLWLVAYQKFDFFCDAYLHNSARRKFLIYCKSFLLVRPKNGINSHGFYRLPNELSADHDWRYSCRNISQIGP